MSYVLGHSTEELERLTFQAQVLQPITLRLLQNAGIKPGMRILDLGCGAGDVAMLAGDLVGPSGFVLGIDRSPDAIELATHRASAAEQDHVRFATCAIEQFSSAEPFDMVVGRYVMVHQADVPAFIRKAASLTKPGGIIAFHEIVLLDPMVESHPVVPLWDRTGNWIVAVLRAGAPNHDAASRMLEHFANSGLPPPTLFCERPIGGGKDSSMYRWAREGVRTILPHLVKLGLVQAGSEDVDTYESRLRTATVDAHSQLIGPMQIGAWVRVGRPAER